jgi:hypothetical protein
MRRLGMKILEIPEIIVCALRLRHLVVRLGLAGVDNVGELHGVLDEEDGDVVTDDIPVSLLGVELDGKSADIADRIGTASAAEYGRETDEDGRLTRGVCEDGGEGEVLGALEHAEGTECASASGMDNSLRNTLMIKAVDLQTSQSQPGGSQVERDKGGNVFFSWD